MSFVKIGSVNAILYIETSMNCVRTFDIYCPIWIKFDIKILA